MSEIDVNLTNQGKDDIMRGTELLHPYVEKLALMLVSECEKKGLKIKITDTLRTKEEQDKLYAQGRTTAGKIVTNAKYPTSNHCWGIAFDFCRNDGKGAYEDGDGFFTKVGQVGKSLGLDWGGDFKSLVDKPHFEYPKFGLWKVLQSSYNTPVRFSATWTTPPTKSVSKTSSKADIIWLQGKLNDCITQKGFVKLVVDGIFGAKTKAAILLYWKCLNWNKDGKSTGDKAGAKTITALTANRKK